MTSLLIIYLTQQSEQYWFEGYSTHILRGPGSLNIRHWTPILLLILSQVCVQFFLFVSSVPEINFWNVKNTRPTPTVWSLHFHDYPVTELTEFVLRVSLYQKWCLCALPDGQKSKNSTQTITGSTRITYPDLPCWKLISWSCNVVSQ